MTQIYAKLTRNTVANVSRPSKTKSANEDASSLSVTENSALKAHSASPIPGSNHPLELCAFNRTNTSSLHCTSHSCNPMNCPSERKRQQPWGSVHHETRTYRVRDLLRFQQLDMHRSRKLCNFKPLSLRDHLPFAFADLREAPRCRIVQDATDAL